MGRLRCWDGLRYNLSYMIPASETALRLFSGNRGEVYPTSGARQRRWVGQDVMFPDGQIFFWPSRTRDLHLHCNHQLTLSNDI